MRRWSRIVMTGVASLALANLEQTTTLNSNAEAASMHTDVNASSLAKLDCSFDLTPDHHLKVKVKVRNQSGVDLFVLNRPWDLNSHGDTVDDREQVYRFVRNSELRLLWGIAPLPRLETTTYQNIPYATVLKPKSLLEWDFSTPVPVTEYNLYFTGREESAYQAATVKRVVVIVQFVAMQTGLTAIPSGLGSSLKVSTPQTVDHRASLVCSSGPISLEARRRTDPFSRLDMPGEPPEPLILSP